jgi:hypothetical protein
MALSLPDLPAELLLEIVDSLEPSQRRKTMEQLRATHPQIDEKIVHAYALKYHRSVTLHLNRTSLTRFEKIATGYLGANIESVSVSLSGLIRMNIHHPDSECTDTEAVALNSWLPEPSKSRDAWESSGTGFIWETNRCRLDEDFFEFIGDGSCAALLDRTLPKLQNMSSLTIHPVSVPINLGYTQSQEMGDRWRMVMKIMLSAVFNHCRSLQLLNIKRNNSLTGLSTPVFDLAGISSERLRSIKDLAFDLDVGPIQSK